MFSVGVLGLFSMGLTHKTICMITSEFWILTIEVSVWLTVHTLLVMSRQAFYSNPAQYISWHICS